MQKNRMINENELIPYEETTLPEGRYLVFAPHPDDESLGMGGTIALATSKGIPVHVVFITNGDMGGNPDIRKKEAQKASDVLGIDKVFYLNMGDRKVGSEKLPEQFLDEIITITDPSVLFLPSFQEIHPDHRATTQKILTFLETRGYCFNLWFYELNRQGDINRLIDISPVLDIKESAIECYASQIEQLNYKEHALCLNFMRSITLNGNISYAEGFWCHDTTESIPPEQYYFNNVYKYMSSCSYVSQYHESKSAAIPALPDEISKSDDIENQKISPSVDLHGQLRLLKDKINNQAAALLTYFTLATELSGYINEKITEINSLKHINEKNNDILLILEKKISEIELSKSHRLASTYIKSVMDLRLFFRNLRRKKSSSENSNPKRGQNKRKYLKRWFKGHSEQQFTKENSDSAKTPPLDEVCSCSCDDLDTSVSEPISSCEKATPAAKEKEIRAAIPVTGGDPVIRLYSEEEIDANVPVPINDIYTESTTYGNKQLLPVMNNQAPAGFSVYCTKKDLACIDIFMATYRRVNPGTLVLSLYESDNEPAPIRICHVTSALVLDNSFVRFVFKPVTDSDKHQFYITLCLKDGVDERYPGIWLRAGSNITSVEKYHQWIADNEKIIIPRETDSAPIHDIEHEQLDSKSPDPDLSGVRQPSIAVIVPLFNTKQDYNFDYQDRFEQYLAMLSETFESISDQSYKRWQIIVLNNLPDYTDFNLSDLIDQFIENKSRITIHQCNTKTAINEHFNNLVRLSECEYFLVLEPCDTLAQDAMNECVRVINQFPDTDCIYSDEDTISDKGVRTSPFFKPGWSPDLLLSHMYIGSFIFYGKDLFEKAGGYTPGFEACREYDLMLRLSEFSKNIRHIPKVLYHKRGFSETDDSSDRLEQTGPDSVRLKAPVIVCPDELANASDHPYNHTPDEIPPRSATLYAAKAIEHAIKRRRLDATVDPGLTCQSFRVSYKFDTSTLVSIIIPFRDSYEVLETCVQSIVDKTEYKNYEIICVNNQSKKHETYLLLKQLQSTPGINLTVLNYDRPFNYSAINNYAVAHAKGDVILFLNSDTEVISGQWLNAMLEHACRDNVGVVGAKLYYINDTIQHAGVVMGIAGVAGHAFKHVNRHKTDFYHGFPCMVRNVSAVTGACMMIRKSVFEEVGGFDEELFQVAYNDLDLCLKVREKRYEVIYTPFAELYHYESYSRGYCFDPAAADNIRAKWGTRLEADSFYNPNLTVLKEDWSLE